MKLYSIVFSPTGGTQKVAALLTKALGGEAAAIDLTDSKQDFSAIGGCGAHSGVVLRRSCSGSGRGTADSDARPGRAGGAGLRVRQSRL